MKFRDARILFRLGVSLLIIIAAAALLSTPVATANAHAPTASKSSNPSVQSNFVASASANRVYLPLTLGGSGTSVAHSIYWGTALEGAYPASSYMQPGGAYDNFETLVQKRLAIISFGQSWMMNGVYQAYDTSFYTNVRNHGSIPLMSWGSRDMSGGLDQPNFRFSAIYNGMHDAYLRQWAQSAKAWGHPFFLRFNWEMNGDWFLWSEQVNGNQPGDFVKAWRHVHDIFTQTGATNATWVWCPNIADSSSTPMSSLYPGDNYVDWTCLDGYNQPGSWTGFHTVMTGPTQNSYAQILAIAPTKPLMIAETASVEAGDGGAMKATWITDALTVQLSQNFPKIKAIVWFNATCGNPAWTYPIQTSVPSTSAFVAAIGSSYYATNSYSNLNTSPIPAPP